MADVGGLCSHLCFFLLMTMWLYITPLCGGHLKPDGESDKSADVINDSERLMVQLEALLQQGNSSDVSLRVETTDSDDMKVIQVHSLILSLQSQTFHELLEKRNSSTVVLRETAQSIGVFDKFIRYLYCGELLLCLEEATALHELATKYSVSALRRGLIEYMNRNLASALRGGHLVHWYEYATAHGDEHLGASCLQFLSRNVSLVLRSQQWRSLGTELLTALLKRSDLVVYSELELFKALESWIVYNQPDALTAENILRSVRYAMIAPRELFRLQRESPVLTRYHESVRDLLYMAYQFHAAPPPQLAKFFDVNCSLFIPRNYLAPAWGTAWLINSPARDDRTAVFNTQLGPSAHDVGKRVTWNALFSPRARTDGHPRIVITPATSSPDFAGVVFQKTVIVCSRKQGELVVQRVFNFHQSTDENGDFLTDEDLDARASGYLVDGWLHLHVIVKPLYQSLLSTKK
ncbi:BTB/POZ domain-containing protein 17 [Trichomycterus rosablanca]|uniref:BTB/POZ domain-containing protein 17 n=1 Tax=Trichomycterus rosablanca TaxID=2290929 RepID=UPI002F353E42